MPNCVKLKILLHYTDWLFAFKKHHKNRAFSKTLVGANFLPQSGLSYALEHPFQKHFLPLVYIWVRGEGS